MRAVLLSAFVVAFALAAENKPTPSPPKQWVDRVNVTTSTHNVHMSLEDKQKSECATIKDGRLAEVYTMAYPLAQKEVDGLYDRTLFSINACPRTIDNKAINDAPLAFTDAKGYFYAHSLVNGKSIDQQDYAYDTFLGIHAEPAQTESEKYKKVLTYTQSKGAFTEDPSRAIIEVVLECHASTNYKNPWYAGTQMGTGKDGNFTRVTIGTKAGCPIWPWDNKTMPTGAVVALILVILGFLGEFAACGWFHKNEAAKRAAEQAEFANLVENEGVAE